MNHPDLRCCGQPRWIAGSGVDDHNGFVDDVRLGLRRPRQELDPSSGLELPRHPRRGSSQPSRTTARASAASAPTARSWPCGSARRRASPGRSPPSVRDRQRRAGDQPEPRLAVWSKAERTEIAAGRAGILVVVAAAAPAGTTTSTSLTEHGACRHLASYSLSNIVSVAAGTDRDHYAYFSQCKAWWRSGSADSPAGVTTRRRGGARRRHPQHGEGRCIGHGLPGLRCLGRHLDGGTDGRRDRQLCASENPTTHAVQVKNAIMNSVDYPRR